MKRKFLFLLALLLAIVTQGAWAETVTITTTSDSPGASEKTFTSGVVTIKVMGNLDTDGAFIDDDNAMTITATDKIITSVVLRIGFYADDAEKVLASSGTRSISGNGEKKSTWVTFSDVSASSVTITTTGSWMEIDEVTVNYTSIVSVTGVTLSQSEAVLTVGGTQTLTATVAPANATNKSVTWTTSNASVATVANGVVTAVGVGSATITATTTDGAKTASCAVTVANPIAAASADGTIGAFTDANGQTRLGIVVTLGGKKYAIGMSNETDISGLSGASTGKIGDITYYSNADALAKFANNQNEYTAVNVWRLPTSTEFDALAKLGGAWDGTTGHTGWTWTIGTNTLFLPKSGYYEGGGIGNPDWGYYWSSTSYPNMLCFTSWYAAQIGNGGITSGMPLRLFCQLPYVDVTSVTLSQAEAALTVGSTLTLIPTVAPADATNKTVTWTTSDASVATVDANGVVTAQGLGTATITATATNGTADTSDDLSTTCTVTVAAPINAVSEDGTIGAFTDANGQTRMGIVVTLNGNKYAISMSNETDLTGLSGTYTKKVGDYTYYNFADACAKFANNQTDGSYTASNVWRLPTAAEFQNLIALGGSWNGTGYTWTIGGNSLFLPAAGYNDASPVSGVGYYWSSTQPQFLYFYNETIFMPNGGTSTGMPLRLFCQLPYTAVTGVTLSPTEASLIVGETTTLTPTVAPATATDMTVTWTTSDDAVATVTDGVVTAVGAGTATITVTATNGTVDTSDDKTATCTVTVSYPTYNLTANPGADGEFWATFYSDASNYQASSGTKVFAVNLTDAEITMTEISDAIVKSGEGVVLKSNSASITMTPTASAGTGDWTDNSLTGTMTSITNPGNAYVLNKKDGTGVGFYRLSSGGTIGANKAYLTYSGTLAREFFLFDEATGISSLTPDPSPKGEGSIYSLDGRRVSQPVKGLYIVNGKKYIKK